MERVYTTREVCAMLGWPYQRVWRLVARTFPEKVNGSGRRFEFTGAEVERLIDYRNRLERLREEARSLGVGSVLVA
jgi:predicted DNA-binding transcriptional regulator AlpA